MPPTPDEQFAAARKRQDEQREQRRAADHLVYLSSLHGCPKCPAKPGESCKTSNYKPHVARLRLAEDDSFDGKLVRLENDVTQARDYVASLRERVEKAEERLVHTEQMLDLHVRNGRVQVALEARRAEREGQ